MCGWNWAHHATNVIKALALISTITVARADFDLGYSSGSDRDLTNFVTRPEIKVPLVNIAIYQPQKIVPGYWFVGPYASVIQEPIAPRYYQPCQTGPTIYDSNGELVWSGACLFRNQNAVDFRAWSANGTDFLSTILWMWDDVEDKKGHGVIMDSSYQVVKEIYVPRTMPQINMHELNILDDGNTAIYITHRTQIIDFEAHGLDLEVDVGLILDLGFNEIDLRTGEVRFEWWASDHISVNESTETPHNLGGPWPKGWNWIHLNAVDKDPYGDYMISSRYTNSIYKISGKDGSMIWTLGGRNSSFELEEGFNFSRQHDARFLSKIGDIEVITFMDNGGDELTSTSNYSSSLVVSLDTKARVANVTKRWIRPGYEQTTARGNFQLLPNGNAFSAWSENNVISEHSWDGELLMESNFRSDRFVTYRTWKANFTGTPSLPPDVKSFVYGETSTTCTTVIYVSWNGATEVEEWKFYAVTDGQDVLLGSKKKTQFETTFQTFGYHAHSIVEAVAVDGSVLGRSEVTRSITPTDWEDELALPVLNATSTEIRQADSTWDPQYETNPLAEVEMNKANVAAWDRTEL